MYMKKVLFNSLLLFCRRDDGGNERLKDLLSLSWSPCRDTGRFCFSKQKWVTKWHYRKLFLAVGFNAASTQTMAMFSCEKETKCLLFFAIYVTSRWQVMFCHDHKVETNTNGCSFHLRNMCEVTFCFRLINIGENVSVLSFVVFLLDINVKDMLFLLYVLFFI